MRIAAFITLLLIFALLYWHTKVDVKEYEQFKKLKDTKKRQAMFGKWVLGSFVLFGIGSLVLLAAFSKFDILTQPESELVAIVPQSLMQSFSDTFGSTDAFAPMIVGAVLAGVAIGIVMRKKAATQDQKEFTTLGDVQALLPRNNRERYYALAMALNAGFSEELFFRVLLPSLLLIVTANAYVAVVVAVLVFGLAHYYQGKVGVLATTILGAVLMLVYLGTKSIFIAMALHAFIDINGLLLRPLLEGVATKKRTH